MEHVGPNSGSPDSTIQQTRRERLRFADFRFTRAPDGRCSASVSLEWDGQVVSGQSSAVSNPMVDLRVAAEACLNALHAFTAGECSFELIGVKAVRAFDANVIIVSVTSRQNEGTRRLLGVALVEDDPTRGAVLAMLNATNRVLGNFVSTR